MELRQRMLKSGIHRYMKELDAPSEDIIAPPAPWHYARDAAKSIGYKIPQRSALCCDKFTKNYDSDFRPTIKDSKTVLDHYFSVTYPKRELKKDGLSTYLSWGRCKRPYARPIYITYKDRELEDLKIVRAEEEQDQKPKEVTIVGIVQGSRS